MTFKKVCSVLLFSSRRIMDIDTSAGNLYRSANAAKDWVRVCSHKVPIIQMMSHMIVADELNAKQFRPHYRQ